MNEHELDQRLGALQRKIAPARDLWPEIEQQIIAEQSTLSMNQLNVSKRSARPIAWFGLAAGLLMLLGTVQVFLPNSTELIDHLQVDQLVANNLLELEAFNRSLVKPQSTSELLIMGLPQDGWRVVPTNHSVAAIKIWQPALMAGMQENQQAIDDIRRAINQQPQHIGLLRRLADAERKQHRLLQLLIDFNASAIASIIPTNTTNFFGEQNV